MPDVDLLVGNRVALKDHADLRAVVVAVVDRLNDYERLRKADLPAVIVDFGRVVRLERFGRPAERVAAVPSVLNEFVHAWELVLLIERGLGARQSPYVALLRAEEMDEHVRDAAVRSRCLELEL